MADLLGSLLPEGYAAPDVQSILGGELADYSTCNGGDRVYGDYAKCSGGNAVGL